MNEREVREALRAASWPRPSRELRARIETISVVATGIPWTDRVWYSRGWRMTTAAAAMCLITLHAWLSPEPTQFHAPDEETTQALQQLVQATGVPEDIASMLARRVAPDAHTSSAELQLLLAGGLR
jgi:hypothetical protein